MYCLSYCRLLQYFEKSIIQKLPYKKHFINLQKWSISASNIILWLYTIRPAMLPLGMDYPGGIVKCFQTWTGDTALCSSVPWKIQKHFVLRPGKSAKTYCRGLIWCNKTNKTCKTTCVVTRRERNSDLNISSSGIRIEGKSKANIINNIELRIHTLPLESFSWRFFTFSLQNLIYQAPVSIK